MPATQPSTARNRRVGAPIALVAAIGALCLLPSLAGAAAHPKTGRYVGTSSTNVATNKPLEFEMDSRA